jgi:glycerol kinase
MNTFEDIIERTSALGSTSEPIPKDKVVHKEKKLDEEKLKHFFIGSIDQGTTSTRFIIFNGTGEPVAQHQIEFTQKHPESG